MLLILEGACGVGKTTIANLISSQLAVPVYRPFQTIASDDGTEHITKQQMDKMRQDIGLSINSYEEDIYVADVLSAVSSSVILDRSMPSAIAYSDMSENTLVHTQRKSAIKLWVDRINRAGATTVLLETADENLRALRAKGRGSANEAELIQIALRDCVIMGLQNVYRVQVGQRAAATLADVLSRFMVLGNQSELIQEW